MNRDEAMQVLKELISSTDCDSHFIALMPPNAYNILSKGYQIHIKTGFNDDERCVIDELLKKNGYALKEQGDTLVIYKPLKK